jgi:hypothetical protein
MPLKLIFFSGEFETMTINKNSVQGDRKNGKKYAQILEKVAKMVAKKCHLSSI